MLTSAEERRKLHALQDLNVTVVAGHTVLPSNRDALAALLVASGKTDSRVLRNWIERLSVRDLSKLLDRAYALIEGDRI